MFLGKGRSTDSNTIVDTCLMERYRVHLSFDNIGFTTFGYRLLGEMESIEYRALVEYM